MFLISQIWLDNQLQIIISESTSVHQKALDELMGIGGVVVANNRQDNVLGSVIVNGKRSVWPLTKAETAAQGGGANG
ncbi:hypothetical protein HNO13_15510 [Bacillus velezensis]|uniref:hypothetical protein n=1 Tax=Bacillus amyloliquefaciens group TaxID=1938374 RepID=UPI0009F17FB4|nr:MULTISPECIES: hypothetical protein [Bacillus amyloliquefaciens group]MEE3674339.1 hypothetical protein [Bacillus velezensis]OQV40028.1 hypothetical protein B5M57_13985 [Bacillus velezensis]QBK81057.1 hypothetical protein EYS44_15620 [Bacillus velezensis]QJW64184.1 hypothetical protein HNO12_15500 [Bacillus amyloliquefaciens]QJW68001.1 hypothetical protein HNO13_15510 [Bacillus velezensis]